MKGSTPAGIRTLRIKFSPPCVMSLADTGNQEVGKHNVGCWRCRRNKNRSGGVFGQVKPQIAGNLALKVLATGGIYLAGGVAVHTLRALQEPGFMKAFTDKGRLSDLMKRIPVHVIV